MKKTLRLLSLGAIVAVIASAVTVKANEKVEAAEAIYANGSLPTTIDLNDYSSNEIRNYYSDLNSKPEADRKGENLLKALKPILKNNQKYYNYDQGETVWKMYEITDRDWAKSPATDLGDKYNPTTNIITGYSYKSYTELTDVNNPYVKSYYMDYSQENQVRAWGNHSQDGYGINREHLWPKSEGFGTEGSTDKGYAGARGDPMHLVAANGWANNQHNNNFYGYVDKTKTYVDTSTKYSSVGHNYLGVSKTAPLDGVKVFEPQDSDKGDIARAMFYMAARYNDISGDDDTICMDNPNLRLCNDLSKWVKSGYTSTKDKCGYMAILSDLLEWNELDPVDEYEIHRNNLLQRNFTYNRNPFIDFPNWANIIWGDATNAANPQSDSLNVISSKPKNEISNFEVASVNYGETVVPTATALTGSVSFSYSTSENGTYSATLPTDAGTYYVKATSIEDDTYSSDTQVKTFRINGTVNTISDFVIGDVKEGKPITPTATAVNGSVTFTYSTSENGPFTDVVPTAAGTYYVKATSTGGGEFESQSTVKKFNILEPSIIDIVVAETGLPEKVVIIGGIALLPVVVIIILIIYFTGSAKTKKKLQKGAKKILKGLENSGNSSSSSSSSSAPKKESVSTSTSSTTKRSTTTAKKTTSVVKKATSTGRVTGQGTKSSSKPKK